MPSLLAALVLLLLPGVAGAIPLQEALLRAKPAVVLVVTEVKAEVRLSCGRGRPAVVTPKPSRDTGSGAFVGPDGYVLTSGQLVAAARRPSAELRSREALRAVREACLPALLARRGLHPGDRPDVEDELLRTTLAPALARARVDLSPSLIVMLSNRAHLGATIVKAPPDTAAAMSGEDLALLKVDIAQPPSLALADSTRAQVGDRVHVLGFPGVVLTHELLSAASHVEATVTSGSISGFRQDRAGNPIIQVDAPAAWGASGGPAVDAEGRAVGVLALAPMTDADAAAIQGFNFLVPSATVTRFLADTPVRLGVRSRFDVAWQRGLRFLFDGDPRRATASLAEADRIATGLPDVRRAMADARAQVEAPSGRRVPWRSVAAAGGVAAIAVLGWALARRVRGRRHRISPAAAARLLDTSTQPPLVIDARDAVTYSRSPVRLPGAVRLTADDLEAGAAAAPAPHGRTVIAYCT